jgi:hypothetical protein
LLAPDEPSVKKLVLITNGGAEQPSLLEIYDYSNQSIPILVGWAFLEDPSAPGLPLPTAGAPSYCPGNFTSLASVLIHDITYLGEEHRLAFCRAGIKDQGLQKPAAYGIVVFDLSDPEAPLLLSDPDQTFNPVLAPCPTGLGGDYAVNDLTIVEDAGVHLLYAACGNENEVLVLDVTNILDPDVGFDFVAQSTPTSGVGDWYAVEAERNLPSPGQDFLYLLAQGGIYAMPRSAAGLGEPAKVSTSVGNEAPQRDVLAMRESEAGQFRRKLWTLVTRQVDYKWKITDVTQNDPVADVPVVEDGLYAPGGSDGAVMVWEFASVYMPNFGGIVRYDIQSGEPVPDADSYRPALAPGVGDFPTEHLEVYDFGAPGAPERWLLSPTARGSFFGWEISETAPHNPGNAMFYNPPAGYWPWQGLYGNDIAVAIDETSGNRIICVDYYKKGGTPEIAIGRYDWDAGAWLPRIDLHDASSGGIDQPSFELFASGRWLFVGGVNGLYVVDVVDGSIDSQVYVNNSMICGRTFTSVQGIARLGSRVYASLEDSTRGAADDRFALVEYTFRVDPGPTGVLALSPDTCHFDKADTVLEQPDSFPGVYLDGGSKVHAIEVEPGVHRVYVGTLNGVVVEMESNAGTLLARSCWGSPSEHQETQDNHVYNIASPGNPPELRVLISQWLETFALVTPPEDP